ncbi:MAG: hypothetical protein EBQ89_06255 [Alphaproteobacteria bacterium]|nr:hypothetical protein [Alphaproteobacteria bacterium]
MPLVATRGAASAQGFGEFAQQTSATYIEDVFSTYLYTGAYTAPVYTQPIVNGIDTSGKGALVWLKDRGAAGSHRLVDTARGNRSTLFSDSTSAAAIRSDDVSCDVSSFNSNGFTAGNFMNQNGNTYVSWTFRKQPKFFDVVTYTGDGNATQTINHNLGSNPGAIIVKRTNSTGSWYVYHRSTGNDNVLFLNTTAAATASAGSWATSSTNFTVGNANLNIGGDTYVAYLFAHDAGGFGLTGTDNVISCGSYTGNGSATGPTVTLGYEPQWLMIKNASGTGNWNIIDNMRGMPVGSADAFLEANTSDAEATADWVSPTATGFNIVSTSSEVNTNTSTYIYIAIRRGPMKVPTSGTSVYNAITRTGTGSAATISTVGFPPDWVIPRARTGVFNWWVTDRLRGANQYLLFDATNGEGGDSSAVSAYTMNGFSVGTSINVNESGRAFVNYAFLRAPGFFDVVCYTGTAVGNRVLNHNLAVAPELLIFKSRATTTDNNWSVQCVYGPSNQVYNLNTNYFYVGTLVTSLNSSTITLSDNTTNNSVNYVAYLFATCAGVSKVTNFTGTGTLQTINCGFAAGSRFVLIKRTDSTGDWYVWDSSRGLSSSTDPYLLLNSTAAEVTGTNWVDTTSTGFQVTAASGNNVNINGASYIALAIA